MAKKKATKKAEQGKKVGTPMYVIRRGSSVEYTADDLNEIDLDSDQEEVAVEVYGFLRMGKVLRKTTLE